MYNIFHHLCCFDRGLQHEMCIAKEVCRICCVITKNVLNLRKKYFFFKNNFIVIILLVFVSTVIIHFIRNFSSVMISQEDKRNASCYEEGVVDALPSAEGSKFSPRHDSIFFIETSCRGGLTTRQACSIEAAARVHPRRMIYVLFSAPVSKKMLRNKIFARLRLFYNIRLFRVHLRKYARNTPLEEMVASTPFYGSRWWMEHTSDIVRFLTLYKWGGIYLDMDTLVVKPLTLLGCDWVGKQDLVSVNGAAIAMSLEPIGRRTAEALLNELKTTYRHDLFGHNGPEAITRVLKKLCSTPNVSNWSSETCEGFEVYGVTYFYPIYYTHAELYFKSGQLPISSKNVFAHHFWNKVTSNMKIEKDSPYMKLAEEFCPSIFQLNEEDFGT